MKDAHRRVLAWSLPLCLLVGTAQSATLTIGADAVYQTLAAAYAAAQPGDVLEIADNGTYNESLSILKADLTLRAAPGVRPTIRGKAASQGAAVYVAADGVTIAGLTLDGIDRSGRVIATLAPTRLTIRDNVIRNGDYGIFTLYTAGDAQGFRIERNDLSGNNTDIWLHNVTGAWVADNRVHSNSGSGIGVGGYSSHIQVVGNQVYADLPPTQLHSRYGILLSGDDNRVEHNEVHGTVQGICLSWSTGNLVAYNRAYDNVSQNFALIGALDNRLDGNLDYFTGVPFKGGISILLANATSNTISQHSSIGAGRGVWFTQNAGASLDNRVRDSLFVSDPITGKLGLDATSDAVDQAELSNLVVYGYRTAVGGGLVTTGLSLADPKLTEDFYLSPDSWALIASSTGQHLGANGTSPLEPSNRELDHAADLAAFTTNNTAAGALSGGRLLLSDPKDTMLRDAGILGRADLPGDLDVIVEYRDQALLNPGYQAKLALLLAGPDYAWATDQPVARLTHSIHDTSNWSWHDLTQPGGPRYYWNHSGRLQNGILRLTRQNGLIRAYAWNTDRWQALIGDGPGITSTAPLRVGLRMLNNWNDDYSVQIERIQIQSDADGDGLLDAEEAVIGTFPDRADSDADGVADGAEGAPRDARTQSPTPAALAGDAKVQFSWFRNADNRVFIVARNLTGATAPVALPLSGLPATSTVAAPLEGISLAVAAGQVHDTLPPFGRRLYRLPTGSLLLLPAPPAAPLVQPRTGPWTLDLNRYFIDLYGASPLGFSLVLSNGAGVSATLSGASLSLTPTGNTCGLTTLRIKAVNGLGDEVLVDLPVQSLGTLGPNLLVNGGFEQVGNTVGQIPGWTWYVWSGTAQLTQDTVALEGQHAARLQGIGANKAAIRQTLTLGPGRYRLSARVASWDLRPGEYNLTSTLYVTGVGTSDLSLKLIGGDRDWTTVEQTLTLTETRKVTVYLFNYGSGYLWVDDVRLQTLEPCATDADGAAVTGLTGDRLNFLPPVTTSDLLLAGYCGDPGMTGTGICRRLAGVDPATLTRPRAAGPLTIADFPAWAGVGGADGYLDLGAEVTLPTDWSGYDYLEVRLTNPGAETLNGIVEIRDRQTTDYWSRVNWYTQFVPGEQVIRIPLQIFVGEKSVIKQRRRLDLTAITRLFVDVLGAGQVYVQTVRLTVEPPYQHDFARLIKLDAGTDLSPIMHGFTALTPDLAYRPEFGWGLTGTSAAPLRAEDRQHPDDLLRDWISIPAGGVSVDLPNGRYHVWMMLEDPGYWEYVQSYDWRAVSAEGAVKYSHTMTADTLWARIFAHSTAEDRPGDDIWDRYIPGRYRPVEFDVDVADGKLDLTFASGNYFTYANTLSALLIWPTAQEAQGQAFVAELWQRLRAHFETEYVQTLPAQPEQPLPAQESTPGVLVYQRGLDRDIQATDWPDTSELVDRLGLDLARGEFEPLSVGLYATSNLTLTQAELTLPGLATQGFQVRTKVRRTAPGGVRYSALPYLLDDLTLPLALPTKESRRLWFVVQAPTDTQLTQVEGRLTLGFSNGSQVILPVSVRVSPFILPAADIPFGYLGALPNYPASAFPAAVDARALADLGPSLQLAADHAMTSFSGGRGGPAFSGYAAGSVKIDWGRFDSVMGAAAGAFPFAPLSYGGLAPSGGLGFETYQITDTLTKYGKPYGQVLTDVLGAVRTHTQAQGWPEPVYTVGDEPGETSVPAVNALADAIHAAGSKTSVFTSFTAATEPRAALAAHVDQVYLSHHNAASLQTILDQGHACGTYNLGGRYARGVYQFKLRSLGCRAGFYQFAFNSSHGDMYYALDGREDDLVAALPTAQAGKLLPTLDIERFREAVDDYRYLLALEQAISRPVNPQAAAEARVWLDNTLASLTVSHTELADPPLDADDLDAIRAVARQFILAILGLTPP